MTSPIAERVVMAKGFLDVILLAYDSKREEVRRAMTEEFADLGRTLQLASTFFVDDKSIQEALELVNGAMLAYLPVDEDLCEVAFAMEDVDRLPRPLQHKLRDFFAEKHACGNDMIALRDDIMKSVDFLRKCWCFHEPLNSSERVCRLSAHEFPE